MPKFDPENRVVGYIRGTATVKVDLEHQPIHGGSEDPADVYSEYVRHQVKTQMAATGRVPINISVSLTFNDE